MINEASDELEAIDRDDRMKAEIVAVRVDLYHAAKNWGLMRDISQHLAESYPDRPQWSVQWAYALREMDKVQEAKEVALRGLELHPDCAILRFNLACYHSLLGEFPEAKKSLTRAIELDERFKPESVEDDHLAGL